jgi:hypothetical protein
VCFWDSLTAAVRAVPTTDGVAFEAVATFVLPAAPPLAALGAGGDPAEAIFAPFVVPAAGPGIPTSLVLPAGALVAGGVNGA